MSADPIRQGALLEGDALESEHRSRRKDHIEDSIPQGAPIPEGWSVLRQLKTRTRICKPKDTGRLLEDKLWRFFYQPGIHQLSSRNFTVIIRRHGETTKLRQIDVLAIDGDIIFLVECKARGTIGKRDLSKDIADYATNKEAIETAIKRIFPDLLPKFVHVFATENIEWDENDRIDAKSSGIQVWDEYDLLALQELASLAGEGAKYQIYNRIFFGKKIKGFEVKVPAIEAKMAGHTFYAFVMSPEDLLKIAFVHHRTQPSSFLELADSYQRIIKKSRIREIESFITDGGFFPGAIIVNFHRPFLKKEPIGEKKHLRQLRPNAKPVALTLPPYYGCAWIVDGQHRLYAYADTEYKASETLPVVAFVSESSSLEARMFVDVNKNQKSIEANLLWDLYEDLYADTTDDSEAELYAISRIAKALNSAKTSPFFGHIAIPKEQNSGNLTLTTVCTAIHNQKLVSREEGLLFRESYTNTIQFAADRIASYFQALQAELPQEWSAGDHHYIRTNSGFVVLTGILRDMLECSLSKAEIEDLSKFRKAVSKFLEPMILHLLDCDPDTIASYRGAGGASQKSRQVRFELTKVIRDAKISFRSIWLEKFEDALSKEDRFAKRREGIAYYLDKDEDGTLEFKGSLSFNVDRFLSGDGKTERSPSIENEGVLKAIVGFLNTKGGEVLVGVLERKRYEDFLEDKLADCPVNEDKIILGLDFDYHDDEWDGFLQRLLALIEARIGAHVLDSELVSISRLQYETKDLCLVKVHPADAKQYLLNKFYVRRGNKTNLLEGPEIDRFWSTRPPKDK